MRCSTHGFSLVELSIVLVILGLLVGGILGGQSLIRAAELRSITTDLNKYITAINAFRGKYDALPGDMSNAIDYWGATHATPATCITTQGTGTQTCNGDGNGHITSTDVTSTYNYESFRAWQQLSIAGLIEGSYTGVTGSGGTRNAVIRQNVPPSKITGGGYSLIYNGSYSGSGWAASNYRHIIMFGSVYPGWDTTSPIISPEDAYSIDNKLDDGKPLQGNVMTWLSAINPNCTTSDTIASSTYNLTNQEVACGIIFKLGF